MAGAAALTALMVGAAAGRAIAVAGGIDQVLVGVVFAVVIAAPVFALPDVRARLRSRPSPVALLLGLGLGAALLLPGAWLSMHGYPAHLAGLGGLSLPTWGPAVSLLAVVEEVAFRGALQPRLRTLAGPIPSVVLTAVVFAAIHVPLYGLQALPLDIGAGLLFGVLRESTGSVAGCAVAHVVADLGYWWVA